MVYSRDANLIQCLKINVIYHINRLKKKYHMIPKKKYHMILSIDAEKAFGKIQYPFTIKTLSKIGIEGSFLNLIKNSHRNLQLTFYLTVKNRMLLPRDQNEV